MGSNLATRLSIGDLQRCCEQTAVLMSLVLGDRKSSHGTHRATPFRGLATRWMLGYMRDVYFNPRYFHLDIENKAGRDGLPWKQYLSTWKRADRDDADPSPRYCGVAADGNVQDLGSLLDMDLVLSPLDGAGALRDGRVGSTVALAAGAPKCFPPRLPGHDDSFGEDAPLVWPDTQLFTPASDQCYLVLALHPEAARLVEAHRHQRKQGPTHELRFHSNTIEGVLTTLVEPVGAALVPTSRRPCVAINEEGPLTGLELSLPVSLRRVGLHGSGIAAGLAAFTGKHDLRAAVLCARPAQLTVLAMASRILGARIVAVPMRRQRDHYRAVRVERLLTEADVVRDVPGFVIVSGVSSSPVLPGTTWISNDLVEVSSLVLSQSTGSVREIRHTFTLSRAWFRDWTGKQHRAQAVVDAFLENVRAGFPGRALRLKRGRKQGRE